MDRSQRSFFVHAYENPGRRTKTLENKSLLAVFIVSLLLFDAFTISRVVAASEDIYDVRSGSISMLPEDGTYTTDHIVTFAWPSVEGAQRYFLQVDNDPDFCSPEIATYAADPKFTSESSLVDSTYYWRVKAKGTALDSWLWSEAAEFTVLTVCSSFDPHLGIPAQWQHKDTEMLCVEGCTLTGTHAWNVDHLTRPCDHCDNYCVRASISMVNSFYQGNVKGLSQDRISYYVLEERSPDGIPENDLGHGLGLLPAETTAALSWALNGASITNSIGKPTFNQIKTWIDNNQPILRRNVGGPWHATVIEGYEDTGQLVHVVDPWTATETHVAYSTLPVFEVWVPPASGVTARSDEASLTQDSDSDGIIDFDETNRFGTDANNADSDGDLVHDLEEIRCYTFESDDSFDSDDSRKPDPDNDGSRAELDYDSDNGGASDGEEDLDRNGRVDTAETDPLDFNDDPFTKFAYVYCTWGMLTMQGEIGHLHSLNPNKYSFAWYNEDNIGDLWANLGKYRAILVDEDSLYDTSWSQLGGPVYTSFKSHTSDLEAFIRNGGGLFTSCENDLFKTQIWDWLPTGMRVTSYDPETVSNVQVVFDPGTPNGLYSYPNTITDSYLSSKGHTHGWFTNWDTGYTVTVRRTDNNNPMELYGVFENSAHTSSGCIVVSHVEAEAGDAWEYLQNQLDFIIPAVKFTMIVAKPMEGGFFHFGDEVPFEAMMFDDSGDPGTGASVTVNTPTGDPISLIETPAGSGVYKGTYTLLSTDPIGTWAISFVASIEGEFPKKMVPVIIPADQTPPTITVITPRETPKEALQDGATLKATVSDSSGVEWVKFSIRETDGTVVDPSFESMSPVHVSGDTWQLAFNTYVPKLPDGNYLFIVNASDMFDNEGSKTVLFSIRNWASLELLPATTSSKAGRTMPIKFSLRVYETVDPAEPFVYNEQLTIKIYRKGFPGTVLQTSTYGTGSKDYRIDTVEELYITNFKTLPAPITYTVEIYRKDMLIGSFDFRTVK